MLFILWLSVLQGIMGVFDLVYHHEMTEKLTWKPAAAQEMWLHGLRNGLYSVVFFSFGFLQWHGVYAWIFAAVLLAEVTITLCDFVIEDRTRRLPATERVTHTLLALNYGAVLGLFSQEWLEWLQQPTGFVPVYFGFLSWVMGIYAFGVLLWFFRDYLRSFRLKRMAAAKPQPLVDPGFAGKKVLVTGGTGFIGQSLCRSLIASGCRVTVLTRDISMSLDKFNTRIELIESLDTLRDDETFEVIINLAGEPVAQRWTARVRERIFRSRIETAENILSYIERATVKPRLFINGSAIGWYGIHPQQDFDESSAPSASPGGAFAKDLCHQWEETARKAKTYGVRTVLLRIGIVLEKDGGTLAELLFPFDFGIGGPLGRGQQWFSWIHREDLIGMIFHIMRTPSIEGAINGTAPAPVTNREFSLALGRAMKRPSLLPLPGFVLRLVFGQMADEVMLNGQRVLPRKAVESGYQFKFPVINQAMAAIFAN